jgi:hypothetical protein
MSSTISTPFLSQETVAISFLAGVYLNFLACLVNVCASTALTALWFQHLQMKPRFDHLFLAQCNFEICCHLCGITVKKVKAIAILCFLCTPVSIFGTHLAQNLLLPSL